MNSEMTTRLGGANGSDLILGTSEVIFQKPVSAIIVSTADTIIAQIKTVDVIDTSGYIGVPLGLQTLITFKEPITSLTLSAGTVMVYFI